MSYISNSPFGTNTIPTYPNYPTIPQGGNYMSSYTTGRSVLPGRTVSHIDEIAIGEIPQDGSVGIFPQSDGKIIWAKSWNSDGTIKTMKFIPAQSEDNKTSENKDSALIPEFNMLDVIQTIDDTNQMVSNLYKELSTSSNQNGSKDKKENR